MSNKNEMIVSDEPARRLLRSEGSDKRKGFNDLELMQEFQRFSRGPFVEILVELIQAIPTPENLRAFAAEHPDKWVTATKTMANLAGYHDKLEVEGNISLDINKMGDAQLMARLDELGEQIKGMGIRTGGDIIRSVSDAELIEPEDSQ